MGFLDASGITRLVTDLKNKFASKTNFEQLQAQVETKQDELISGTNIKTINSQSVLGSGNIDTFHGRVILVSLSPDGWTNNGQFVTVTGVNTSSNVIISPMDVPSYYYTNKVYHIQGTNTVKFYYTGTKPINYIQVKIFVFD